MSRRLQVHHPDLAGMHFAVTMVHETTYHRASDRLAGHLLVHIEEKWIMKRTMIFGTCLAFATLLFVSACSHKEEVRPEREILRETPPPAPTVTSVPAPEVTVRQAPPAPRVATPPPPPAPGYAWVPGYWTWSNNAWIWVPGKWERPPERTATWVPGQWRDLGDRWVWRQGPWE
jgi:hypothetical protein